MNCSIMWFLCSTVASDAVFVGFLLLLFFFGMTYMNMIGVMMIICVYLKSLDLLDDQSVSKLPWNQL